MISVGSEVQVFPGPPFAFCEWGREAILPLGSPGADGCEALVFPGDRTDGAVAQLGEHLLCKQGVSGSIPLSSTNSIGVDAGGNVCLLKKIKFASAYA